MAVSVAPGGAPEGSANRAGQESLEILERIHAHLEQMTKHWAKISITISIEVLLQITCGCLGRRFSDLALMEEITTKDHQWKWAYISRVYGD
jgi:hypothetical protein